MQRKLSLILLVVTFTVLAGSMQAHAAPQAHSQRLTVVEVYPFEPFQAGTYHVQDTWNGNLTNPFIYNIGIDPAYLSNIVFTPTGGATCERDGRTITCTGPLTQMVVSYDCTYVVSDYMGTHIWLGYGGNITYGLDYTIQLIYPEPLVYVAPWSTPPTSHEGYVLTWFQANTQSLVGAALFHDPRVHALFLPLVVRDGQTY